MEGGIPVFDGKGYEIWSKKMKTLFLSQELWDLVQQGYGEATYKGLRENNSEQMRELRKKDSKALYLIQQGVSNEIFHDILNSNSSKEAWDAIRKVFDHGRVHQIEIKIDGSTTIDKKTVTERIDEMTKSNTNTETPEECIFKVPQELCEGNEEFYEPKVLAIGPYHRGKPHLDSMEEHKFSYLKQFLQRTKEESVVRYVEAVIPEVKRVRKCYGGSKESLLSDEQLVQMLVVDGCFIIELLLKFGDKPWYVYRRNITFGRSEGRIEQYLRWKQLDDAFQRLFGRETFFDRDFFDRDGPLINSNILLSNALQNDLLLIDNQIPFFILQILYRVKSSPKDSSDDVESLDLKLKHLTLKFLYCKYGMPEPRDITKINIDGLFDNDQCHLLDIAHKTLFSNNNAVDCVDNPTSSCFVNSATKLEEANVRLVKKFGSIFDIEFNRGKLMIPCFSIDEHFEIEVKNFIALELCQQKSEKRYCDYVFFLDHLIASSDDVNLLIKRGIITNHMIDAKFVDNIFMKLTKNIVMSDNYTYSEISKNLNEYCKNKRHKHWGTLKKKYFQSPWSLMSLIAASILIGLTFTQTVFSIIYK
ncbi:UPF0481 protein At3g47200-like [Impatiens glandulifera]|uniref:UPF0481 protein At3g47200-like n=1 Tax=Impatiens glandulifera TaxID=253017 RepID=UPI001FB13547|nr:UPF0481 protein At3g47200-like [Impatiens glandulifera]